MEDKISPIDEANCNSEDGAVGESRDDSRDHDEPIERKRRKTNGNSVPTNEPDDEKDTCDDQRSPIVLHLQQDPQITDAAQPIETQTFWNSNYKSDLDNSMIINPLSVIQKNPTTEPIPSTSRGFSASDMLQPEMEMIPISLSEATVQCPLCHLYFSTSQIEIHSCTCMDE